MLEYWYKERRTLIDFRRGVIGPYFDSFAEYLKAKGFPRSHSREILGKCCQFNSYLVDQKINRCSLLTDKLVESFLDVYFEHYGSNIKSSPREPARRAIRYLFAYLIEIKVLKPAKPTIIKKPYSWILNSYIKHLREKNEIMENTIKRSELLVSMFLELLGRQVTRKAIKRLSADTVETHIKKLMKETPKDSARLASALRSFFRYSALRKYMKADFSGLIPGIRRYRFASLPKGMEDSGLEKMLKEIDKATPNGARDYAIIVLMMAYGIRGVSAAELLLEDVDWQSSKIRIRAQKGGKEVVLPLLEPVGDAIIQYLRYRFDKSPFREVFLTAKAPFRPLNSLVISNTVRKYLQKAGIKIAGSGSTTLRHSWAIRALSNNAPIKTIADVLGHRYIDTTFIYAKADLKTLREVAMPWPKKR